MKKLMLALSLTALGVACRASAANVHDTSNCTGKDCAECAKMEDCASCPGEKAAECQKEGEAAVCPVTGKSTN